MARVVQPDGENLRRAWHRWAEYAVVEATGRVAVAERCVEIVERIATSSLVWKPIYWKGAFLNDTILHGEFFGQARPVATMVVVAALLDPTWRIEMEAEALVGSA